MGVCIFKNCSDALFRSHNLHRVTKIAQTQFAAVYAVCTIRQPLSFTVIKVKKETQILNQTKCSASRVA